MSGSDCFVTPKTTFVEDLGGVYQAMRGITAGDGFPELAFDKKMYSEFGNSRLAALF